MSRLSFAMKQIIPKLSDLIILCYAEDYAIWAGLGRGRLSTAPDGIVRLAQTARGQLSQPHLAHMSGASVLFQVTSPHG